MSRTTVNGSGGLPLAVWAQGPQDAPPVVLVHGYPDTHRVWDAVAAELAADFRVIRYDVRGAGESAVPGRISGYRLDALAGDLFAVLESTAGGRAAHVVGHDWGSIQAWEAVTDSRAPGRIASFTTMSGPCLDHVGYLRRGGGASVQQALRSWYVAAFHVPVLPAVAWRAAAPLWGTYLRRAENVDTAAAKPAPTLADDAVHGMNLYRANVLPRLTHPRERRTDLPVLQVELRYDPFVTEAVLAGVERWAPHLRREQVHATHWAQLRRPELVASLIRRHASGA